MRKVALAFVAAFLASVAAPADAGSTIDTYAYEIIATGASGEFRLDYDTGAASYSFAGSGIQINTALFTSANTDILGTNSPLTIGGTVDGVGLINPASTSDDFMLTINPNLDNQFAYLDWHLGGSQNGVIPIETQILRVLVGTTSPTPEPATWAMMLLGFAGIGLAMRRTRRLAAA